MLIGRTQSDIYTLHETNSAPSKPYLEGLCYF